MKFGKFLADKIAEIIISLIAWLIIWNFLAVFHIGIWQIFIIGFTYFSAEIIKILWEFLRKKHFYDSLISDCEKLDRKYLLSAMTDSPDFYEGQIFSEVLYSTDKSMCDHVNAYRQQTREFQEYIELWVHEVKLPLSALMIMCHNNPEISGKYTQQIRRIDDCVENVMYYARGENAEKDYLIKEITLKSAFNASAVKNRAELQQHNVTIKTENLNLKVMTDGKWLEYIIGQLIGNSLRYFSAERDPEINIYAVETDKSVIFHFRDNGIGIPETDLPYIFEKSYTGVNGHTHTKSTGMGLYIIRNLCRSLGHDIKAESVRNVYTDIIITFGKNNFLRPD
ncbi:MAG: sensor histidine kinase [Ruminococcus sp.]|nr:sensor histidine kinase [Ruminococcus sp.]